MPRQRKSLEKGHRRKFLVIIDDTPECGRALHYSARRAEHSGGGLVLLYVIAPADFPSWLGVENIRRAEAMEEAETTLGRFADMARRWAPAVEPELVIREGSRADEIVKFIDDDEDVAVLVLGVGTGSDGPGPLISALVVKSQRQLPVPITLVPGNLDEAQIAAIA